MNIEQRKEAFVLLGKYLQAVTEENIPDVPQGLEKHAKETNRLIDEVHFYNGWFTRTEVRRALKGIISFLDDQKLSNWVAAYPEIQNPAKVGLVLAGNIPLVGFHDVLSVLICGHTAVIKPSSDDDKLIPHVLGVLTDIEPAFKEQIVIGEQVKGIDAVIATGSNNTHRYFEYYFGSYPHIFRKSKTSVAVLTGTETDEELKALGEDIFSYYGLGCRNVSKLFIPADFDLDRFFGAIYHFKDIVEHKKYGNNYDYHKAIYLMNSEKLIENGFLLLRETEELFSPVGTLFYERYDKPDVLESRLKMIRDDVQCIVSGRVNSEEVPFGKAQYPELNDYADGVDTMSFLTSLP